MIKKELQQELNRTKVVLDYARQEIKEKDKEIERLKDDNKYLNKVNIELSSEKNRLKSIIKEVREYIGINEKLRKVCTIYDVNGIDILEILDKVGSGTE